MLDRAAERVGLINSGCIRTIQADFRVADLPESSYDVIIAAAVLHHLRGDDDWSDAFHKLYQLLEPGGTVWITDLVSHEQSDIHKMMWGRYGEYLTSIGDTDYRDKVFAYIDREDSPRPRHISTRFTARGWIRLGRSVAQELVLRCIWRSKTRLTGYQLADCLNSIPEGSGNGQCFHRAATVDWDHENWEIPEEQHSSNTWPSDSVN